MVLPVCNFGLMIGKDFAVKPSKMHEEKCLLQVYMLGVVHRTKLTSVSYYYSICFIHCWLEQYEVAANILCS